MANSWMRGIEEQIGRYMRLNLITGLAALLTLSSNIAYAALTLDATRYIYDGSAQSISAMVSNPDSKTFGAQVWIDNINESDTRPTFVATPSFFKVSEGGRQVFRLMKMSDHMPKDRESVYWLNLQEIPPAQEGSGIAMAIRTKVKLIYRPEGLNAAREGAESNLSIERLEGGSNWLVNNTPYVFAIGALIGADGKVIQLDSAKQNSLAMFQPGDRIQLPGGGNVKSVEALNDYGNLRTYELKGQAL